MDGVMYPRYSTANALAKAKALCTFNPSFSSEPRFLLTRTEALSLYFDALSSREPVTAPDQVRDRLSLENALERRLHGGGRLPAAAPTGWRRWWRAKSEVQAKEKFR
jgi:hypothetical protein